MNQFSTDVPLHRSDVGVVVIGRNEGDRLRRCFESIDTSAQAVIYVDSNSSDGSVDLARSKGVDVVELDLSIPFTPSRARNVGFARLRTVAPSIRWVQFVDGDCEIVRGWLEFAHAFLLRNEKVAAVRGGVRERFPERSVYNLISDETGDAQDGEIDATGGILMMRCEAFVINGGFRDDLFVGEERELCRRLRTRGWQIWRLSHAMAWHDLDMMHFGQWWRRTKRTGFSNAQGAHLFGKEDRSVGRHVLRALVWGGALPAFILTALAWYGPVALPLLLIYPAQVLRMASAMAGPRHQRLWSATFLMLGKIPELLGQFQFWTSRRPISHARAFDKS